MQKVPVVGTRPAMDNIRYAVHLIVPMEKFCMSTAKDIRRQRIEYLKTVLSAEVTRNTHHSIITLSCSYSNCIKS